MRIRECRFETAVRKAVASREWDEALRRHVERCAACREVALVAGALFEWNRAGALPLQIPDVRQLQWRADWLAARSAGERATRPIVYYTRFAAAAAAVGLGALGWRVWPLALTRLPAWNLALPSLGIPHLTPATFAAGALGILALLLAVRTVLARD
jgi:hypothetical protein